MIKIHIEHDAGKLARGLRECPAQIRAAMVETMDEQNQYAVGDIVRKRMSKRGPDTLGVVTSRLRSSVRASRARVVGDQVSSAIGTNVVYAGVHEFGFHGTAQVRSYQRRQFNKPATRLTMDKQGRIVRRKNRRKVTGTGQVRAHARRMNMPARAPIQRGIEARRPYYARAFARAINDTLKNI